MGYTVHFSTEIAYQTNTEYTAAAAAIKVILQGNLVFIFPFETWLVRYESTHLPLKSQRWHIWIVNQPTLAIIIEINNYQPP